MRILLVRHGHAEPKKTWSGDDADRPLVARGRRQAKRLGKLVGGSAPDLIISSPALRCRQTVDVLAADTGLPVVLSPALARDRGKEALDLFAELTASGSAKMTVVLCSHREVMVEALPVLARQSGRKLGHRLPGAKGGLWVLDFNGTKLRRVAYRAPLA